MKQNQLCEQYPLMTVLSSVKIPARLSRVPYITTLWLKFDTWKKRQNILITLKLNQVVGAPTGKSKTEHRVIVLYSGLMRIHIDGRYS